MINLKTAPPRGAPVSALSDQVVPLTRYFADDGIAYEQRMLAAQTDDKRVAVAESFLLARLPPRDAEVEHVLSGNHWRE